MKHDEFYENMDKEVDNKTGPTYEQIMKALDVFRVNGKTFDELINERCKDYILFGNRGK